MIDFKTIGDIEVYIDQEGVDIFELSQLTELSTTQDCALAIVKLSHVKLHGVENDFRIRVFKTDTGISVQIDQDKAIPAIVNKENNCVGLSFTQDVYNWNIYLTN